MKHKKQLTVAAALLLSLIVVCAAGALVTNVTEAVPSQCVITAEVSTDFP